MNKRGFTLIEVLLYVSLSVLLLGALSATVILTLESRARAHVTNEVEQQASFIFNRIEQIAQDSSAITSPVAASTGSSLTISRDSPSDNPTTLSLSGTTLMITRGGNSSTALHNDQIEVTNFVVSNLSRPGTDGIFRIELTLAFKNEVGRSEFNYSRSYRGSWSILP